MKKICKQIVVVCLLLVGILNNSFYTYASSHKETTEPGNLYALSAVLMDGTSGRVLYGKNAEEPRAMASTTKIMTCILILEPVSYTHLDDELAVVGTINLDYRSLYLHFECATWMYQSRAVGQVKEDMMETFEISKEISLDMCRRQNIFRRGMQSILRLFAPML